MVGPLGSVPVPLATNGAIGVGKPPGGRVTRRRGSRLGRSPSEGGSRDGWTASHDLTERRERGMGCLKLGLHDHGDTDGSRRT